MLTKTPPKRNNIRPVTFDSDLFWVKKSMPAELGTAFVGERGKAVNLAGYGIVGGGGGGGGGHW